MKKTIKPGYTGRMKSVECFEGEQIEEKVRRIVNKSNETLSFSYVVPESTKLKDKYEIAWDIDTNHMIDAYAILQKWCDQSLSSDFYRRLERLS